MHSRGTDGPRRREVLRARAGMSRRQFIKLSGGGIAGVSLLSACGGFGGGDDGGSGGGGGETVFSFGPDDSGTLTKVLDRYNKQADTKASYQVMPADTGQYFDRIRTQFQAGGGDIDIIGGDVIWPGKFAANGWIADLSDQVPESERSKFLDGPIQSNTYEGKLYGVPWFTDAGMLYYRVDLLDKAGFSEPPTTYDELIEMAKKVQQDEGTKFGFVFQGATYEGGVVDGLEYIWNAGGDVLDPNDATKVVIDSPEAAAGLAAERHFVDEGVTPEAVVNYTETESQVAFTNGDAVFMRNWPYIFGIVGTPDSKIKADQLGVAPLPTLDSSIQSSSGLGGWNFLVNAQTDDIDAAFEMIDFFTAPEQQKFRALTGGFLPTLKELYEDQEILDKVPVVKLGGEALANSRSRPVSPYYSDMSLEMAEQFNASLKGEIPPDEVVGALQTSLEEIVAEGK